MASVATISPPSDPFQSHLVALLSLYELQPYPHALPIPRYDGPTDWQTDSILRSLGVIARRMYAAEESLALSNKHAAATAVVTASSSDPSDSGSARKRRNVGDLPHSVAVFVSRLSSPPLLLPASSLPSRPLNLDTHKSGTERERRVCSWGRWGAFVRKKE